MRRLGWRSLHSRLTLLVAAAVALAIAVCAAASWFIVRRELYESLERSLTGFTPPPHELREVANRCVHDPEPSAEGRRWPGPVWQVVLADNQRCVTGTRAIKVAPEDVAEAAKPPDGEPLFRPGVSDSGTPMWVRVSSLGDGAALVMGLPTHEVYYTLRQLALILGGVAVLGVVGAASAGMLISRTALRPVGRLTRAVEHIAQTQDLDTTIPVEGDDEIARLSRSFNAMTTALAGSRDRQRQLVADAGHELRTPLTSLRTNIDLLLRSEQTGRPLDPETKQRLLANVKAQFAELSTLVGDLLQLSRGDTDHEPHVELGFHEVVEAAIDRARLRGAEVSADLEPWYVMGHSASLERAVLNLLDNAAKFSRGPIEVVLRDGELTVRDHGPGIPEEELPHVFDRFWRSPSARSLPGSGLGLAIVAQAVAEAGGQARLANAPGGGAVATVTLPGTRRSHHGPESGTMAARPRQAR
ncbi:sensor histidine kinase [Thermoactinospora rubra]|uniref:sensor histidine kinase n=1 Tax=Thermoactinospora rubra TaxID=1088767 RepID=UPI000A101340|nr:HAMP domain-containing sensor histidine kinase [Thermoactinospora rubra]